jgi:hypothetical protein
LSPSTSLLVGCSSIVPPFEVTPPPPPFQLPSSVTGNSLDSFVVAIREGLDFISASDHTSAHSFCQTIFRRVIVGLRSTSFIVQNILWG